MSLSQVECENQSQAKRLNYQVRWMDNGHLSQAVLGLLPLNQSHFFLHNYTCAAFYTFITRWLPRAALMLLSTNSTINPCVALVVFPFKVQGVSERYVIIGTVLESKNVE